MCVSYMVTSFPLRHLISYLGFQTSGPLGFSNEFGKALVDCNSRPIQPFTRINAEIPVILNNDLSTDQQYFYDICQAVINGVCTESLAMREPGKIVHSRWLTTANRILRLYVSTIDPPNNIIILVTYILKVYAPIWFMIKIHPSIFWGAKHVHQQIILSRYLPDDTKLIIDPVIQRNSYFAHPECLLLAMLADSREHIRKLAYLRIKKSRLQQQKGCVRKYQIPKIIFTAQEYYEIIDWRGYLHLADFFWPTLLWPIHF